MEFSNSVIYKLYLNDVTCSAGFGFIFFFPTISQYKILLFTFENLKPDIETNSDVAVIAAFF